MYRVDILIVRYVRNKYINSCFSSSLAIGTSISPPLFTALRDIYDYNKLSDLPGVRNSHSVTRNEVALDLETVISSYAVATRTDFDVKKGIKGINYYSIACLS